MLNRLFGKKRPLGEKTSFSQCGEDLIIQHICMWLRIDQPAYLDIGAHHPSYLSNTYLLYLQGSCGVCVEPDPSLCEEFRKMRKRDVCVNAGVGEGTADCADFYIMSCRTLNTFSREEAERYAGYGDKRIEKVVSIPLVSIESLLSRHFARAPHLVSLDVEGLDLQILRGWDFDKYRPEIFCIETLTYTENNSERKLTEIIEYMTSHGYFVYADTYVNTIFVSREAWARR